MAGFPSEWLEELRSKSNIIDVIGRYVPMTRKGRSFWGCCPFHHEKTPSFQADEDKQLFYCFGCKASGDVITFIRKIENVDFMDAVKHLAEKAGMALPSMESDAELFQMKEKRDRVYKTLTAAANHYYGNLSKPGAEAAKKYLEGRGVSPAMAKRFGLGVSLNWEDLVVNMLKKGFTCDQLKEAGLADEKDGRWYDVFGGRLMFPVLDKWLNVVGFSGRVLEKDAKMAKYRNSAQTIVFDKSKLLYGINLIKLKKQKENVPYVIIVEGQMDVISLHQAGFDTAVAGLGTALTAHHARLLKNYCGKVYLCYDGDSAGQAATIRGLDILSDAGLEIRVMSLPDNLDPDDLIKQRGAEAFKECMDRAKPLLEFKLATAKAAYDMNDAAQKAKYAVDAVTIIKKLVNPVEQEEYLKIVRNDTGYTMDSLKKQLAGDIAVQKEAAEKIIPVGTGEELPVRFILYTMLTGAEYADAFDLTPFLRTELFKDIYTYVLECRAKGRAPRPEALYETIDDSRHVPLGEFLNYDFNLGGAEKERFYADSKRQLAVAALTEKIGGLSVRHDNEPDIEKKKEIAREIKVLHMELIKLKK